MATRASLIAKLLRVLSVTAAYTAVAEEAVDDAMAYLIRNYNFKQAQRYAVVSVSATARSVALPADVRQIVFVHYQVDGQYYELSADLARTALNTRVPGLQSYRLDGQKRLVFNAEVPTAGLILVCYFSTTGNGMDSAGEETLLADWLPAAYPDAVLYRAVLTAAPEVRKPELQAAYAPLWQDVLTNLTIELHENEYAGSSAQMRYQSELIWLPQWQPVNYPIPPQYSPSLDFSDARNSQYIAVVSF
jgi:hypothetical protein